MLRIGKVFIVIGFILTSIIILLLVLNLFMLNQKVGWAIGGGIIFFYLLSLFYLIKTRKGKKWDSLVCPILLFLSYKLQPATDLLFVVYCFVLLFLLIFLWRDYNLAIREEKEFLSCPS